MLDSFKVIDVKMNLHAKKGFLWHLPCQEDQQEERFGSFSRTSCQNNLSRWITKLSGRTVCSRLCELIDWWRALTESEYPAGRGRYELPCVIWIHIWQAVAFTKFPFKGPTSFSWCHPRYKRTFPFRGSLHVTFLYLWKTRKTEANNTKDANCKVLVRSIAYFSSLQIGASKDKRNK